MGGMAMTIRLSFVVLICGVFGLAAEVAPACAKNVTQTPDANLRTIHSILQQPDARIDLAKVKLTIDHMIDPSINVAKTLKQLNAMAKQIKTMLPAFPDSEHTLNTLKIYLYQAGSWNEN